MSANVVVRDLSKRYGGIEAAREVSFSIEAGEIFGLLGPNGAGKTTTLECLIGLRQPDSGELKICGLDVRRQPRAVKQKIGVALQTTSLQDKVTPREALRMFGSFYREHESPPALLERFALGDKADAPFDTLSGGQRQRLALALAFVNRPSVVILDEPTTGLDPLSRRDLHRQILQMKQDGYTVLLTTHQLEEAGQLCDRIAIIDGGRIVATGAPRDLIAQSTAEQSVRLSTKPDLSAEILAALPGVRDLQCESGTAHFRTDNATATLAALAAVLRERRVELVDLQVRKASLEDVFFRLTRAEQSSEVPSP